ncbi:hypothetical protein JCM16163A_49910 [Paenibacillus sp. YK5]
MNECPNKFVMEKKNCNRSNPPKRDLMNKSGLFFGTGQAVEKVSTAFFMLKMLITTPVIIEVIK